MKHWNLKIFISSLSVSLSVTLVHDRSNEKLNQLMCGSSCEGGVSSSSSSFRSVGQPRVCRWGEVLPYWLVCSNTEQPRWDWLVTSWRNQKISSTARNRTKEQLNTVLFLPIKRQSIHLKHYLNSNVPVSCAAIYNSVQSIWKIYPKLFSMYLYVS